MTTLVCPTCRHSSFRHGDSTSLGRLAIRLFGRTRQAGCAVPGCTCPITTPHQATTLPRNL